MITAKEKRGDYCPGNEHVDIFRKKIKSQFHAAVFRMVSSNQFCFAFGEIKMRTVRLGKSTH